MHRFGDLVTKPCFSFLFVIANRPQMGPRRPHVRFPFGAAAVAAITLIGLRRLWRKPKVRSSVGDTRILVGRPCQCRSTSGRKGWVASSLVGLKRVVCRLGAVGIGRSDHSAAVDAAAGEECRPHRSQRNVLRSKCLAKAISTSSSDRDDLHETRRVAAKGIVSRRSTLRGEALASEPGLDREMDIACLL